MVSEKNTSTKKRKCYVCNSVENEPRIIGNYTVELSPEIVKGQSQLVCQGCRRKLKTQLSYKSKNPIKSKLRFFGFRRK